MHGEYKVKFCNAQQAKSAYSYRKIKEKLHKTNASIWFNKICKMEQLSPKYIHITVNGNNRQSLNTKKAAIIYRINQELKFLYKKKCLLNKSRGNRLTCKNIVHMLVS
jgi:hypothetical protein